MTNFRCFENDNDMIMKDYNEFNEIIPIFLIPSQIESIELSDKKIYQLCNKYMYKILTLTHAVCMNEYVTGHTSVPPSLGKIP